MFLKHLWWERRRGQWNGLVHCAHRHPDPFPRIPIYLEGHQKLEAALTTITVALPDDRMVKLNEMASRLGVAPEELVRVSIEELLTRPEASALELVSQWLAEESDDDEQVWARDKAAIEENRLSDRKRFRDSQGGLGFGPPWDAGGSRVVGPDEETWQADSRR